MSDDFRGAGTRTRTTLVALVDPFPCPKSTVLMNVNFTKDCATKGVITNKIKHAIKLKTSPARLAQLLQPSLAFCFSLQPIKAHHACFILLVIAP